MIHYSLQYKNPGNRKRADGSPRPAGGNPIHKLSFGGPGDCQRFHWRDGKPCPLDRLAQIDPTLAGHLLARNYGLAEQHMRAAGWPAEAIRAVIESLDYVPGE